MLNPKRILEDLQHQFINNFSIIPFIGIELEFYLTKPIENFIDFNNDLCKIADKNNIFIEKVEQEKGENQFEIQLQPSSNLLLICDQIEFMRKLIKQVANSYDNDALFNSKPFIDRPGSALHIHLNFLKDMDNYFADEKYLNKAIAGLLYHLFESMIFFAPYEEDYNRFNDLSGQNPTHLSWGGNNRTTCLRIPISSSINKRIEHRVSSSNCDPILAIICILSAALKGLENDYILPNKIFGNAFDAQYKLTPLPNNLSQALTYYKNGKLINKIIINY